MRIEVIDISPACIAVRFAKADKEIEAFFSLADARVRDSVMDNKRVGYLDKAQLKLLQSMPFITEVAESWK